MPVFKTVRLAPMQWANLQPAVAETVVASVPITVK
jgi:hypothetical protein